MGNQALRNIWRRLALVGVLALAAAAPIDAQPGAAGAGRTGPSTDEEAAVAVDPIRCWWRTSTGSIRVGEPFILVLTCAVIENDALVVVPDQSRLEPSVMQLPPFEMLGGTHHADLWTANRRFLQYEYRLRLIKDDLFGKDAALAPLQINYRLRTAVQQGASVEGRDQTYLLPAASVRVLSLVPADATDIREAPSETFGAIDEHMFRANMLTVLAGVLFTLGAVLAVLVLVRAIGRYVRRAPDAGRLVSDRVVLAGVARELQAVQRQREQDGWNEALAGRALSAFRILGAYALAHRVSQTATEAGQDAASSKGEENGLEGQVLLRRRGWWKRKRVLVSGSVTAASFVQALARAAATNGRRATDLQQLQTALGRFSAVRYGRNGTMDEAGLDESLAQGLGLVRGLKLQQLWFMKRFGAGRAPAAQSRSQVWSR